MFNKPRNTINGVKLFGGFKSDNTRDIAMTNNSNIDIAWVRGHEEQKKLYGKKYRADRISGTQRNLTRRFKSMID